MNDMLNWIIIQLRVNKWLIFNWIISDTYQYLEPFIYS